MKLKSEKKDFQSLGAESKQFSVDTSDTMVIRLLRDKMYKNKIGAVSREIASNSRDANREAGRGDVPIVITIGQDKGGLLSENTISISFKDNGIGISPERMEKIFLKYGSSTKRDTDEFTGGFGIGAKTPFAYNDNFFITTVVEDKGVRTRFYYQAVITSDGKNEVSRMLSLGEETTTEQTGTEIIVPIKSEDDRKKFEFEVLYATMMWETKPTLKGFENQYSKENNKLEKVYETESHIIISDVDNFYGEFKHIALIDGIPYTINPNNLKLKGQSSRRGIKYIHKFSTGAITVSGSREDIEYIEENVIKLEQSTEKLLEQGRVLINVFLNDVSTFKEACIHSNAISNAKRGYGINSGHNVKEAYSSNYINFLGNVADTLDIKDDEIYTKFDGVKRVSRPEFHTYNFDEYALKSGRMCKYSSLKYSDINSSDWNLPMYYMDLSKAEPTRNAMLKELHPQGYIIVTKLGIENIYFPREFTQLQKDKRFEEYEENDKKMLEFFDISFSKYSSVEKLRKIGDKSKNLTDIVSINFRVYRKQNWSKTWEGVICKYDKVDKTFENILAETKRVANESEVKSLAYFVSEKLTDFNETSSTNWSSIPGMTSQENSVRELLLQTGVLIIGVSSSKEQYFKDAKIPTMADAFNSLMEDKVASKSLMEVIEYQLIKNSHFNANVYTLLKCEASVKKSITNLVAKFISVSKQIEMSVQVKRINNLLDGVNEKFVNALNVKLDKDFKKDFDNIVKFAQENPMLKIIAELETSDKNNVSISPNSEKVKSAISDYIGKFNK